jgi:RNA polymerase sigma-70 factor, ECF subfamily
VNTGEFVQRIKPHRRELLAHCYRMLASVDEAEDVVQETYVRAWRAYEAFEERSSFRAWLYKIATNACLTALEQRTRRTLPSGLARPTDDPHARPVQAEPDLRWVEPIPDAMLTPDGRDDPAATLALRQGVRLALIAGLQFLPPRQRAVLILREVLSFSAGEVGAMLEMTTQAVKSALQRARARLHEVAPSAGEICEPTEPEVRTLLERYIAAFESSDPRAIEVLLCEDATLEMIPSRTWFSGKRTCAPYIQSYALARPGDWQMVATSANGQPAVIAYLRGSDNAHHPFGVAVLSVTPSGIARITVFGGARVAESFASPGQRKAPEEMLAGTSFN